MSSRGTGPAINCRELMSTHMMSTCTSCQARSSTSIRSRGLARSSTTALGPPINPALPVAARSSPSSQGRRRTLVSRSGRTPIQARPKGSSSGPEGSSGRPLLLPAGREVAGKSRVRPHKCVSGGRREVEGTSVSQRRDPLVPAGVGKLRASITEGLRNPTYFASRAPGVVGVHEDHAWPKPRPRYSSVRSERSGSASTEPAKRRRRRSGLLEAACPDYRRDAPD